MTGYKITDILTINNDDITVPSSTAKYPLGKRARFITTTGEEKEFIYIKAHTGLTAYVPLIVNHNGTDFITKVPVTGSSLVVIPQVAVTTAYYFWGQIKGVATSAIGAETYAVGDALQVLTTGVVAVVDGTTGDKVRLSTTFGVSMAAGSSATNISIYMYGDVAGIAAT